MPVRVIVVDDQPVVRAGFVAIIDGEPDLTVVGEAGDGATAVDLARRLRPDVVLMDIRMPGMDGLTATGLLTSGSDPGPGTGDPGGDGHGGSDDGHGGSDSSGPKVLVLTTFDLDQYVFHALRVGASGFLLKDAEPDDLLAAVRVIAAGDGMLAPAVTRRLIDAFGSGGAGAPAPVAPSAVDGLTPREREVLILIAGGLSNSEIGQRLGVATGTVKTHVNALLNKLGVRDRVQATILAYDVGLVRPRG